MAVLITRSLALLFEVCIGAPVFKSYGYCRGLTNYRYFDPTFQKVAEVVYFEYTCVVSAWRSLVLVIRLTLTI